MHARAARPSFRRGRHKLKRPGSGARAVRVYRLDAGVALSASSPSSSQLSSSQPCESPCSNAPKCGARSFYITVLQEIQRHFSHPDAGRCAHATRSKGPIAFSARFQRLQIARRQPPREADMVEQRRRAQPLAHAGAQRRATRSIVCAAQVARWVARSAHQSSTLMRAAAAPRAGCGSGRKAGRSAAWRGAYRPACAASTRARSFFAQASSAALTCPQVAPPASCRIGLARALSR
jgi:hypothetical protein